VYPLNYTAGETTRDNYADANTMLGSARQFARNGRELEREQRAVERDLAPASSLIYNCPN